MFEDRVLGTTTATAAGIAVDDGEVVAIVMVVILDRLLLGLVAGAAVGVVLALPVLVATDDDGARACSCTVPGLTLASARFNDPVVYVLLNGEDEAKTPI